MDQRISARKSRQVFRPFMPIHFATTAFVSWFMANSQFRLQWDRPSAGNGRWFFFWALRNFHGSKSLRKAVLVELWSMRFLSMPLNKVLCFLLSKSYDLSILLLCVVSFVRKQVCVICSERIFLFCTHIMRVLARHVSAVAIQRGDCQRLNCFVSLARTDMTLCFVFTAFVITALLQAKPRRQIRFVMRVIDMGEIV